MKIMLVVFLISTGISTFVWGRFKFVKINTWIPPEQCTGMYPTNYSTPIYAPIAWSKKLKDSGLVARVVNVIDGSLRLIPVFCFPILTFLLIRELRKAKKHKETIGSSKEEISKSGQTTKMIIMMTVAYIIAETPIGIYYLMLAVLKKWPRLLEILVNLLDISELVVVLNATSHFFICMIISSLYRNTFRDLFYGKSKQLSVSVIRSESFPN